MPYRVLNNTVIQRLTRRFDLEPQGPPTPVYVPDFVYPVTDVGQLLSVTRVEHNYVAYIAGINTMAVVPANKRWWIYSINVEKDTGDGTFQVFYLLGPGGTNSRIKLEPDVTATSDLTGSLGFARPVDTGWQIQYWANVGTPGFAHTRLLIREEDAY